MNHVTIGDGCSIQNSIICSNVQLQDRVVLKDCQVSILFWGSLSLPLFPSCLMQRLVSHYYVCLPSRLVQVLWLLLEVSAKGRRWLRKRNEQKGVRGHEMIVGKF